MAMLRDELDLENDIAMIKDLMELLPSMYLDDALMLSKRQDYWNGELLQREEQLYNLRHGDKK